MKTSKEMSIVRPVVIFCALALVFAVLLVISSTTADSFDRLAMIAAGSAVFGSGLTYFMVAVTRS